jgi:hypothetical protein
MVAFTSLQWGFLHNSDPAMSWPTRLKSQPSNRTAMAALLLQSHIQHTHRNLYTA